MSDQHTDQPTTMAAPHLGRCLHCGRYVLKGETIKRGIAHGESMSLDQVARLGITVEEADMAGEPGHQRAKLVLVKCHPCPSDEDWRCHVSLIESRKRLSAAAEWHIKNLQAIKHGRPPSQVDEINLEIELLRHHTQQII